MMTILILLKFSFLGELIWYLMSMSYKANIIYNIQYVIYNSLYFWLEHSCSGCLFTLWNSVVFFIADVQLLILEYTVLWQPIRMERPPPRLLSVSGVSVSSFLLISFLFLFWSFRELLVTSLLVFPCRATRGRRALPSARTRWAGACVWLTSRSLLEIMSHKYLFCSRQKALIRHGNNVTFFPGFICAYKQKAVW